jgi:hypothetical protein
MYFELSYSRRKALACPYSFKRLYATGESIAIQQDAEAGILGHVLIASYIKHLHLCNRQRDTEWLAAKFSEAVEGCSEYVSNFLETPISKFMDWYTHRKGVTHRVEEEYWVTAEGHTLNTSGRGLEAGEALPCDCYHGRADWIEVGHGGQKATIHDWKLGWDRSYLKMSAQDNEQLMGYCWLYLCLHPACQTVVGAIHPLRFTTVPIYGSWKRDHLREIMPKILAPDFALVRDYYAKSGDRDWPAEPNYEKVCRWCMLGCPRYEGED